MIESDVERVIEFYMNCYNENDNEEWTYETTYKRSMQIFTKTDSHCFILEDNREILGFTMGYVEEFIPSPFYFLSEIVVSPKVRGKGYGSEFMAYIEEALKEFNIGKIMLLSANDEMHKYFYGRLGYTTHDGIICMTKKLKP
ncbi:MAG: GNAT family N-acetyltransferase [Spirochaetales bacterium]